jgi:hypothetical protein
MNGYGLMAEFAEASALLEAARRAYAEGYRQIEAYTPFPVEGLAEVIGWRRNRIPLFALAGGLLGGVAGYLLQWYTSVVDYPINSGGRPLHSWPAFIPTTFELTVLGAALAAFFGMLILNGLPRLYHPVFNAPRFDLSRDRFFLCVRAVDARFETEATRRFLETLGPVDIVEVAT